MTIDLITLAAKRAYETAVLLTGDGDHVPAVERIKAEELWVILAYPIGACPVVAHELAELADEVLELDRQATAGMLIVNPERR